MKLKGSLFVQNSLGRIAVLFLAPIYFAAIRLMGYRVRNLKQIRKECYGHFRSHEGPWIICANHLTMIDSMILTYSIMSLSKHLTHYRLIPWNVPERNNFQRNIILTVLCYLAKCIPINRGGDRDEMKAAMEKCNSILKCKQTLLIFPEGGRSRTGFVDKENYSYGVGRFIKDFEDCKVMCIYLRGDGQENYGAIPRFAERFTFHMEVFQPDRIECDGLRSQRYYAKQIIDKLSNMEEIYFASDRQRCRRIDQPLQQGEEPRYEIHRPRLHQRREVADF